MPVPMQSMNMGIGFNVGSLGGMAGGMPPMGPMGSMGMGMNVGMPMHPGQHHPHLHPHGHPLAGTPLGFQHRRSPQPPSFAPPPQQSQLQISHSQTHTPRPPLPPTLPPLHLGTFVYPRTPFPFVDFPRAPPEATPGPGVPVGLADKEVREIHATILVPCTFLPLRAPRHPALWGGAPIPSFNPLFASPQLVHHLQSGMPYGFRRPHPFELDGVRRVYTDDSDLVLCALHAGVVSWASVRAAKRDGRDLRLEVRLTREARFVGGFGARLVGGDGDVSMQGGEEEDVDSMLSYGWGNSHDGSGVEVLKAEFVKVRLLSLREIQLLCVCNLLTHVICRRALRTRPACVIVHRGFWSTPPAAQISSAGLYTLGSAAGTWTHSRTRTMLSTSCLRRTSSCARHIRLCSATVRHGPISGS